MANFDVQIQALAGTATQSEMDEWMGEGVREIVNVLPPNLKEMCFTKNTFTSAAAGSEAETITSQHLGSIYAGSYSCRKINPFDKYKAATSGDVLYATATDPAYYVEGGKLNILPASSSGVYYSIPAPSINASGVSVIANFPDEAEYLVVLYAAIKVLHNKLNEKSGSLPTLVIPVAPSPPSDPNFTFANLGTPPTYTSPTVGGAVESLTAAMTPLVGDQVGTDNDFRDFSDWFSALGEMIEDDEDIELAGAQIEKINSYIQTYNIEMQNQLNIFNDAAVEYQAKLTEATQTSQLGTQEYSSKLTKFQLEVSIYTTKLNANVQEFTTNLQKHTTDYTWLKGQYAQLKTDYFTGLQMLTSGGLPQVSE